MHSRNLLDLPVEILHLIFTYFCSHCCEPPQPDTFGIPIPIWKPYTRNRNPDLYALASLCLVCKRLWPTAQGILFHEYHMSVKFKQSAVSTPGGRLLALISTVTQRLDLAKQVKRVHVSSSMFPPTDHDDAWRIPEQAAQRTGVTLPAAWKPQPFARQLNAEDVTLDEIVKYTCIKVKQQARLNTRLIAMLLVLLPRLEHLSLETSRASGNTFLLSMQTLGVTDSPLKSAALSVDSPTWTSFFNLASNLETLHLHGYKSAREYVRLCPLPNLKNLRLTMCRLHKDELAEILSACTGLKSFFYEADWPSLWPFPWQGKREERGMPEQRDQYHFQPSDAVTHLLRHCDTLRFLHLDLRRRGVLIGPGEEIKPVPSLEIFTALEHLFLHTSQLWGHWSIQPRDQAGLDIAEEERLNRILPQGIVSLHVAGTNGTSPVQAAALRNLTFAVERGAAL